MRAVIRVASLRQAALIAVGAGVYVAAVQTGLWLKDDAHAIALFWPAAGVGATAVILALRTSPRCAVSVLAAIASANVVLNLHAGNGWSMTAAFTLANTAESAVAGLTLTASRRRHPGVSGALPALLLAAAAAVTVSAFIAVALLPTGLNTSHVQQLLNWAVPDLSGILVVTSIVLTPRGVPTGRRLESACQFALLLALCALAYWFTTGLPIEWIPLGALLWSAKRLGPTWTAVSSTITALFVAIGAGHGRGPFGAHPHSLTEHLSGQAFSASAVVMAMTMVAVVAERERVTRALALRDPLTGLANRTMLSEVADRLLATNRAGCFIALFYCDLDGFKQVNDSYGHAFGDSVLHAVAEQLRSTVRAGDLVARIGGDEFVILCPDLSHPTDTLAIRARLAAITAGSRSPTGQPVTVTVTVGHAVTDGPAELVDMLRLADRQMYLNKPHAVDRRRTTTK